MRAYVLISTAVYKVREVAEALMKLPNIEAVEMVSGPYNIILIVEGPDVKALGSLVMSALSPISGIIRKVTCLSI